MRTTFLKRPSPAMAVAVLALFIAVGGTSYAAAKIGAGNIRTGAVGTRAVKDDSLTGRDIRSNSLSSRSIGNRTLDSTDIKKDSLGGATIREERLDTGKLDVSKLKTVPGARRVPKDSVGASEIAAVTRRFGGAVTVANAAAGKADVSCKKGEIVVGGGGRWATNLPGQALQSSFASTDSSWSAVGSNASGAPRRLQAFAMCLAP